MKSDFLHLRRRNNIIISKEARRHNNNYHYRDSIYEFFNPPIFLPS